MSDQGRDRDPGDGRDEFVSRRYRALARERPSADLDQRVRDRARTPARAGTPAWQRPLAIAAVLAVSLAVVLEIAGPRRAADDPTAKTAADEAIHTPDVAPARESGGGQSPAAVSRFAAPPASESLVGDDTGPGMPGSRAAGESRLRSDGPPVDDALADGSSRCLEYRAEPAAWLDCIDSLEAAGESDIAASERRAFAESFPDLAVPPD